MGAARTGIRLSPGGGIWGVAEDDAAELNTALLTELALLANPDLVERLRTGLPVAPADRSTFYQGGDAGYLTYPTYQHTA